MLLLSLHAGPNIKACTMCFWLSLFRVLQEMEVLPVGKDNGWTQTFRVNRKLTIKQPASQAGSLSADLGLSHPPHISWVSSSTPEIIYAMTFPGRITLPLGRPARGPWAGVTQTQGSKVMGNNPSFIHSNPCCQSLCPDSCPCSWNRHILSWSYEKKKKKKAITVHP